MKTKDKALIDYANTMAGFLKRLQAQITSLEKRVAELEAQNTGTKPRD